MAFFVSAYRSVWRTPILPNSFFHLKQCFGFGFDPVDYDGVVTISRTGTVVAENLSPSVACAGQLPHPGVPAKTRVPRRMYTCISTVKDE
jgi:hypothetical protein